MQLIVTQVLYLATWLMVLKWKLQDAKLVADNNKPRSGERTGNHVQRKRTRSGQRMRRSLEGDVMNPSDWHPSPDAVAALERELRLLARRSALSTA